MKLPELPPLKTTPRENKLGTLALVLGTILPLLQPVIEKSITAALSDQAAKEQLTLRLDNAERRLKRLERRGRFLHGVETVAEAKLEVGP